MRSVDRPRARANRLAHHWHPKPEERRRTPDDLVEEGETIRDAFVQLANAEPDFVKRKVFLDLATTVDRAFEDVARQWRDMNG